MASTKSKGRVLVAMSGGVDSSVAAALLKDEGYDVIGVTMQVWDYGQCDIEEGFGTCCSSIDVDDARAVADKLDFPFYVINCEEKFQKAVIDPFVQAYLKGQTPSPCVSCNTHLKFDHLIQKMKELDCDYLATGHYAKITQSDNGRYSIVSSDDDWKDQTYFLFTIDPSLVHRILFPVGHLQKSVVREIAESRALVNARKKDSMGICFVGKQGYAEFVASQVGRDKLKPGKIKRYPDGEILGDHSGIHQFTHGQRRGLGLDHHETLFVLKIDPVEHIVWVGDEKFLYHDELKTVDCNLLDEIQDGERLRVRIRHHHRGAWANLYHDKNGFRICFEQPQRAITPGQAAVFYRENSLVGGGWIV